MEHPQGADDEGGHIECWVNDELVYDVDEDTYAGGKVGVVRFRATGAEFKQFRVGKKLSSLAPSAELLAKVAKLADKDTKSLSGDALTLAALRERARLLEQQAAQLRKAALALHQKAVGAELAKLLSKKDEDIDLLHAALAGGEARQRGDRCRTLPRRGRPHGEEDPRGTEEGHNRGGEAPGGANRFLFTTKGFHGSRGDYYNRSNSYLSEVIDDREGLPITLSVLYLHVASKLGLKAEGVGLPGHFVVRHVPAKGKAVLLDVYEGGAPRPDTRRGGEEGA